MLLVAILTIRRETLDAFRSYEHTAARIMARHGGVIERVVVVDDAGPTLRELHIVRFPTDAAVATYRADPELIALAPRRAEVIEATEIWQAADGPSY